MSTSENKKDVEKLAIKSPKVLKHAQNYFACEELKYLELEKQTNFENLINCHWNARVLLGEYISVPYYGDQVISEFTLYLLEDLTFYKTNKYTGGLMKFVKTVDV